MAGNPNIVEAGKATQFAPNHSGKKPKGAVSIRKKLIDIMGLCGEFKIPIKNIVHTAKNGTVTIKLPTDFELAMKLTKNALSEDENASTKAILAIIDQTDIYDEKNKTTEKEQDLSTYITKANEANPLFLANVRSRSRIRLNRGGTRSGKTYSLSQIAIDWLLSGYVGDVEIPDGAFDIVRKTLPALKASVLKDLLKIIRDRDLSDIINHHKTDKTFTIKGIDREINYFSVDDEHKVRGAKRKILWANEADGINFDDFRQLNMRGVILCFLDMNPSKYESWLKKQIEEKRFQEKGDVEIIISTFRDNHFLTPEEVEEIEYLAKGNPDFWAVFGMGQYAKLAGVVYPNWELYDKETFDYTVANSKVFTVGGIDFGYTNPTAIIKIHIDSEQKKIYLHEIAYARKLGVEEIGTFIGDNFQNAMVSCDNAEPRTIGSLIKMGHNNVIGCPKKQIVSDIRRINGYQLIVREGSNNLAMELNTYHRPSKDGEITAEEPVPVNNHGVDGARYGIIYGLNQLGV